MTRRDSLAWLDRAACTGMGPIMFDPFNPERARRVCQSCEVVSECRADAIACESWDARAHAGIRAGLAPEQIVALKRKMTRRARSLNA